jgi:hypothetical protein
MLMRSIGLALIVAGTASIGCNKDEPAPAPTPASSAAAPGASGAPGGDERRRHEREGDGGDEHRGREGERH